MVLRRIAIGAALLALAVHSPSIAQSPQELAVAAGAPAPPPGWTVPRTEWGDPDLRGTWPLDAVGRTPTERSPNLGTKAYFTDEEYAAAVAQAENTARNYDREDAEGTIG